MPFATPHQRLSEKPLPSWSGGVAVQAGLRDRHRLPGAATSGYAPHLSAGCDRGGAVGASLEQLKRKQQALEPGSRITDTTVSGKPAFKATYESTKKSGPISGLTVRVSLSADRFCFVDIEARQGAMPPEADQIASSFALA